MKKLLPLLMLVNSFYIGLNGMDRTIAQNIGEGQADQMGAASAVASGDIESLTARTRTAEGCLRSWWNRLSRKKKDAIELGGIIVLDTLTDVTYCLLNRCRPGREWLGSILLACASGRISASITDLIRFPVRIIGAFCVLASAGLATRFTDIDFSTPGIGSMAYAGHSLSDWYARVTGRSDHYVREIEELPSDVLSQLV